MSKQNELFTNESWLIGNSGENVLIVVFTMRLPEGNIRIISARRANRRERRLYEESKGI
ncbi:MAG: BrnT family toxin [Elusimicrobia bacterium]|nr:BrnT family toxin [Elusimicrobiota bacterium]